MLEDATKRAGLKADRFLYAAEIGYVQLTYREPVSVDEIVTNPEIGDEFVKFCKMIEPSGTEMLFKWAALSLRKHRSIPKKGKEKYVALDAKEIEDQLDTVGTLDSVSFSDLPDKPGLFTLTQIDAADSYLYVGSAPRLRAAVKPFEAAQPFIAMSGRFWQPNPRQIALRFVAADPNKEILGIGIRNVGLRLIADRHPLFNMPVHINDAA